MYQNYKCLSVSLYLQAGFGAFFLLGPAVRGNANLRLLEIFFVAGAAGVGAYLGAGGPASRHVVLGFEALAVAVGFYAYSSHHMLLPGTFVAMAVLFRVLSIPHVVPGSPAMANAKQPSSGDVCDQWQPQIATQQRPQTSSAWPGDYFGGPTASGSPAPAAEVHPPIGGSSGGTASGADEAFAPPRGWQT